MHFSVALSAGICGLILSGASQAAGHACFAYEPAIVTLQGTITRHMEYGPPNFGEDPTRDAKEIYWFLNLDQPICVQGKKEDSPDMEGETNIRQLQILYLHGYPRGRGWVGHKVSITGMLFHANSAYHHTKVLITANKTTKLP